MLQSRSSHRLRGKDGWLRGVKAVAMDVQGSKEWHAARRKRVTASDFGSAIGDGYISRVALLRRKVWPELRGFDSNPNIDWGNHFEDVACGVFESHMRKNRGLADFTVRDVGLITLPEPLDWAGMSPDGLITYTDPGTGKLVNALLEIKCPMAHAHTIKKSYYAQIQGTMGFMRLQDEAGKREYPVAEHCFFVSFTLDSLQVTQYPYDPEYFESYLLPRVTEFKEVMYRNLGQRARGELKEGEVDKTGLKARKRRKAQLYSQTTPQ